MGMAEREIKTGSEDVPAKSIMIFLYLLLQALAEVQTSRSFKIFSGVSRLGTSLFGPEGRGIKFFSRRNVIS